MCVCGGGGVRACVLACVHACVFLAGVNFDQTFVHCYTFDQFAITDEKKSIHRKYFNQMT